MEELRHKEPSQEAGDAWRIGDVGKLVAHHRPEALQEAHLVEGGDDLGRFAQVEMAFLIVPVAQGTEHVERTRHRAPDQHGHHLEVDCRFVVLRGHESAELLAAVLIAQEHRPRTQVIAQREAAQSQFLEPEASDIGVELGAVEPDIEQPVLFGRGQFAVAVHQELPVRVVALEA